MASHDSEDLKVPQKMRARYDEIVAVTDAFAAAHLDAEYAALAREMAAVLSRKRPSPLAGGRARSWAAAIVYALGQINFLFDPGNQPFLEARELCRLMEVSQGTASTKAADIRKMLKIGYFDSRWSLRKLVEESPLTWLFELSNGMIVDARDLPRELQEEMHAAGLIPFVPEPRGD
ncbi:DUF6398 domain-containing protein [Longimicrobium sp.]|uniref:DUF6398 domain-containing protein n=1 Tax=Longimicrobium sp. TaxID=2029185 RepID=UPI002C1BCE26|nr:DUF6398 domain-containing protein [Longimicrobium sp.]HSU15588.1 DUF6398 domain-containing protein [Longimicrobium sp.]